MSADETASAIHFSILARPRPSGGTQGVTGGVNARCNRSDSADGGRHAAEVHRGAALVPRAWLSSHPFARFVRPLWPLATVRPPRFRLQHLPQPGAVRPQHTSRTRADSIQIGTERPPRVSLDCLDLGGLGSVHTLFVTCSARIRRTPLHFDTGDDADTCPPLATTKCGQQRRGQRRSDLRKVAHSVSPITLPVGNALARWQLTTRRATRSGFISPFQTVGPTLVGMLLGFLLEYSLARKGGSDTK